VVFVESQNGGHYDKPLLHNKAASRRLTRLLFFSGAELTELRRRINATWLPEKETVADFSQDVPKACRPRGETLLIPAGGIHG
jgi:hypothetical protein